MYRPVQTHKIACQPDVLAKSVVFSLLMASLFSFSPLLGDSTTPANKGSAKATGAQTKTEKKATIGKHISIGLELLAGYRQDNLTHKVNINPFPNTPDFPKKVTVENAAYFEQTNLKLDLLFFKRFFIDVSGGYGLLVVDHNHYKREVVGMGTTSYSSKTHGGYAADFEVEGGYLFNLYRNRILLGPQLGYDIKRISAHHSTVTNMKAPYVGARLDVALTKDHEWRWVSFYDYLFCVARKDKTFLYNPVANFYKATPVVTRDDVHGYKVGSSVLYRPWRPWTFGLQWQMFHAFGPKQSHNLLTGATISQNTKWDSQQLQLSCMYNF